MKKRILTFVTTLCIFTLPGCANLKKKYFRVVSDNKGLIIKSFDAATNTGIPSPTVVLGNSHVSLTTVPTGVSVAYESISYNPYSDSPSYRERMIILCDKIKDQEKVYEQITKNLDNMEKRIEK